MSPFNTLPARRKRIEQGARSPPREPVILVPSPSKSLKAVLALIAGLILLASALPVAAREGAACGVDKAVRFGGVNWESGEFLTAVMRELLERGYGCRTEVVPGNTITLMPCYNNASSANRAWRKANPVISKDKQCQSSAPIAKGLPPGNGTFTWFPGGCRVAV